MRTPQPAGLTLFEVLILLGVLALVLCLAVPNYLRQRRTIERNACIAQLENLDAAKQRWARENNKARGATVEPEALGPYFKGGRIPRCPAGGTYIMNPLGAPPACSLAQSQGHHL